MQEDETINDMPTPARQSAERALQAYEALAAAESYAASKAAWEDFLIHWRRGLNRCDALGRRGGAGYASSFDRVKADAALAYLWAARNADEHGLAPVATVQESGDRRRSVRRVRAWN